MKRGVKKMNQEEKLEFLKKKLEEKKEPLPVSLEKDNVVSMLKSVAVKEKEPARIIPFRRYASAAAVFIIVIAAVLAAAGIITDKPLGKKENATTPASYSQQNDETAETGAASYSEIESYFLKHHKMIADQASENDEEFIGKGSDINSSGSYIAESDAAGVQKYEYGAFGKTNIQTEGVDEADIVKNDGKYIYFVANNKIYIVEAAGLRKLAVIDDIDGEEDGRKRNTINNIYINSDKMIVISYETTFTDIESKYSDGSDSLTSSAGLAFCKRPCDEKTVVYIYDISDRAAPKRIMTHTQDGSCQSSRMVGEVLYTVGIYDVDVSAGRTEDEIRYGCVPEVNGKRISAENIRISSEDNDNSVKSYVVVTAFNTEKAYGSCASFAYLGYCDNIYSTQDTLYIASADYEYDTGEGSQSKTRIVSLSLSEESISFRAEGSANGVIDDQYSMDEYNGYFRIVTTDSVMKKDDFIDVSNIYVFDKDLNTVGKLTDFSKDESVKSARFIGDTAYIVTYEDTDPLFIADLSDPTAPKITGEVKLPGFSSYLHPIGDQYILGVGYGGDDEGADWNCVKITLFDVSDRNAPKVADEVILKNSFSDVNYDPKAFAYYPEKGLVGIPTVVDKVGESCCAYVLLDTNGGRLSKKNTFIHDMTDPDDDDFSEMFRGTYIGNTLFTISEDGVCSFDIESGKKIRSLNINRREERAT